MNVSTSAALAAAARMAGERPSDHPDCVSPSLAAYVRQWEHALALYCPDLLPGLLAYAPRLVGTTNGGIATERRRAWLVANFAVRVAAPATLRHVGMAKQAELLA